MLKQVHPSKRRNTLIANAFFRMGFIEAWGRGFLLIREELAKEGFPQHEIIEFASGLQVTLYNYPKSKEKSKEKILIIISENPQITTSELSDKTGLSISGIEKIIRNLKKEGLLQRVGAAKGGHWEVAK